MGVGVTQTHTIFFIAAVMLAATVVGVFQGSVQSFTSKLQDRSGALGDELATDIRIISDPADPPNNPLTLYVLNTGSAPIDPVDIVVFVNGQAYTALTTDVLESSEEIWRTGQVIEIEVDALNLANGDHRAKVVVGHGIADNLRFSIGIL